MIYKDKNEYEIHLKVVFETYTRYDRGGNLATAVVYCDDLLEGLKILVDNAIRVCLDSEQIDEEFESAEEVIDYIDRYNGDGCDYIISIKDTISGKTYIGEGEEVTEIYEYYQPV